MSAAYLYCEKPFFLHSPFRGITDKTFLTFQNSCILNPQILHDLKAMQTPYIGYYMKNTYNFRGCNFKAEFELSPL